MLQTAAIPVMSLKQADARLGKTVPDLRYGQPALAT